MLSKISGYCLSAGGWGLPCCAGLLWVAFMIVVDLGVGCFLCASCGLYWSFGFGLPVGR